VSNREDKANMLFRIARAVGAELSSPTPGAMFCVVVSSAALLSLANEEHNDTDPPAVVISPALYDNKLLVKNSTGKVKTAGSVSSG